MYSLQSRRHLREPEQDSKEVCGFTSHPVETACFQNAIDSPISEDGIESSPATFQVQHTLSLLRRLTCGDDLRQWTPKARRALRIGGIVYCIVGEHEETAHVFVAPKLALLAASPTLRDCIAEEPGVKEIHLADPRFSAAAVGVLCYWLNSICSWSSDATPILPYPDDVFQALELRHNAQLLCMDKYVRSFEIQYLVGIWKRVPSLQEAIVVSKRTLDIHDPILNAWACRVANLRRGSQLSETYLQGLNSILAKREHRKLLYALDDADIVYEAACNPIQQLPSPANSC
ncbi:hypothetical protein BKA63DRAFT_569034 [Paraphoma chrysanthemicola]|nr:hypothetical protein BKA63DRAFT_569034 [Paraphoma chrysanthemicola]